MRWLKGMVVALAWSYTLGLYTWSVLGRQRGNHPWWLALLNTFAVWLFLPLPFVCVAARLELKN